MSAQKANSKQIVELIEQAENLLNQAKDLLEEKSEQPTSDSFDDLLHDLPNSNPKAKIVEGIFDGEFLIDKNNKKYPVPSNYASKSKLVEGDILKLTVLDDGTFIFKQIGPIQRTSKIAKIIKKSDEIMAEDGGVCYKILPSAISYYQAKIGDEATIILPKNRKAKFAAIENVIPKEIA